MAKTLSEKTLRKSWLNWVSFGQQCYNYEIMQGLGFASSMIPIINELYPDDAEARKEALERHLTYYNTENNWGAAVAGIVASMEEEKANGANITDGSINSIKAALSGPLAGIGDTVTQSLVKTCLLGICCDMALKGNALGPILFFVLMSCYTLGLSKYVFDQGSNVSVVTPLVFNLGQTSVNLQAILDTICPKLLSLITVFITYRMVNKGVKPIRIIIGMFVIGIIGGLLGIIG